MKENFNHILNMMVLVVILGVVITIAAMIIISNKSKMHISQTIWSFFDPSIAA